MRRGSFGILTRALSVALLATLIWAGTCQARIVTVGPSLPFTLAESFVLDCGGCVLTNPSAPDRGSDVSPVEGVILRWRLYGGNPVSSGEHPSYRLRVLIRVGDEYFGAGTSAPVAPLNRSRVEIFPTHLPIKVGQLIGLEPETEGSDLKFAGSAGVDSVFLPSMEDGMSQTPNPAWENGFIFPFDAEVLPPPEILGVSPGEGASAGGNRVAIEGENFAELESVKFGTTEVAYTVESEEKLTATVPPGIDPSSVPISVDTTAGHAEFANGYAYATPAPSASTKCVVPKLKGRRLAAARHMLAQADCKLGRVRGGRHAGRSRRKVRKQSPSAGTVKVAGSAVAVTLGGKR